MIAKMIAGCQRICGRSQGYTGLPVRDVVEYDRATGQHCHAMQTAWEPTPAELVILNKGGLVVVTILGYTPQPMRLEVEQGPPLDTPTAG